MLTKITFFIGIAGIMFAIGGPVKQYTKLCIDVQTGGCENNGGSTTPCEFSNPEDIKDCDTGYPWIEYIDKDKNGCYYCLPGDTPVTGCKVWNEGCNTFFIYEDGTKGYQISNLKCYTLSEPHCDEYWP